MKEEVVRYPKEEFFAYNNKKEIVENKKVNLYEETVKALTQYIENHERNPSEKRWDQYAILKKYLSSKTIGYLSGIGFNSFCRKTRKEIKKKRDK